MDAFEDIHIETLAEPKPWHSVQAWLIRQASSGWLPLRGFWPAMEVDPEPKTGRLAIEVVSHCWQYSHLLECQVGSLVQNTPEEVDVTLTVYFSREDSRTTELLKLAAAETVPNVRWSWRALPKEQLFRRSIGRNHAALNTTADWIWFTDCDVLFGPGCLDSLSRSLQGATSPLVFPAVERLTTLLSEEELASGAEPSLRTPPSGVEFVDVPVSKAKGPLQITHGDVARAMGYCRDLDVYQKPEPAFAKCREDTAFRWLLGTQGEPVQVEQVSRLRHLQKGRYSGSSSNSRLRQAIRRLQDWRRHPG